MRGEVIRLISARKATKNEREIYFTRVTVEQAKSLEDLTDWERIEKMSESEIEQNADSDPDNQPIERGLKGLKRRDRFYRASLITVSSYLCFMAIAIVYDRLKGHAL